MSSLNDIFDDDDEEDFVVHKVKSKHVNIRDPDLSEIDLPEDLKQEAIRIHRIVKVATHKGNNQDKLLFACLFVAGKRLRQPQIPHQLRNKLGIDSKKRYNYSSFVKMVEDKVGSQYQIFTPAEITHSYLNEKPNGRDLFKDVKELWESISEGPEVNSIDIKIVAVWLLYTLKVEEEENICDYFGVPLQKFRRAAIKLDELLE